VEPSGQVIGVVFGASVEDPDTGFTLTANEVDAEVAQASSLSERVPTGACAG
jgi:hypothetical protein